jgi:hypothetical protein
MQPHFHLPHLERLQGRACNKIRIGEISSFMAADIDAAEQTKGEAVIAQGHVTRQPAAYSERYRRLPLESSNLIFK